MKATKHLILLIVLFSNILLSCQKKETTGNGYTSNGSFTYGTNQKIAPFAYLRKEGYVDSSQLFYLSLTFATGAVTFDTVSKKCKGYGEAVRYYFYSPSETQILVGKYPYNNPLNTSNLLYQTQKIEVFLGNYSFNYTTNQQGFLYNKTQSGWINITKNGNDYNITYAGSAGYSNGNIYGPVSVTGNYIGKLIY
jgi:hypothetical protein